jgi:hypothetical protein
MLAGLLVSLPRALNAETECVALFDRLDQIEMLGGQGAEEGALDNARTMYENLGCANVPTDPACRDLSAQIRSMQATGLGNSDMAKERHRIMARLRAAGCMNNQGRGEWDKATEGAQNPEVFEDLYHEGGGQDVWRSNPGSNNNYNEDGTDVMPAQGSGRYRTLCVRACDGYYWPISFSTGSGGFARDQQACAASCPSQEVALYVHRSPGEQSEQAKTVDGEPYAALANAFLYRKRYVKECSCQARLQEIKIISGPDGERPANQAVEETPKQKLEPLNPPPPPQDGKETDVYRSVPIIVAPDRGSGGKSTQPNGLRGVSP